MASLPLRESLVQALRAQIRARVGLILEPRARLLDLPVQPAELRAQHRALGRQLRELRLQVESIEDLQREDGRGFHPQMTIERVLRRHPGAGAVLAAVHLPACGGCSVRFDERLEEAAQAYGLDLPGLLERLNNLLAGTNPESR